MENESTTQPASTIVSRFGERTEKGICLSATFLMMLSTKIPSTIRWNVV